jgi:hypothetical protein
MIDSGSKLAFLINEDFESTQDWDCRGDRYKG